MPWWNAPQEVTTPPVTLERVVDALQHLDVDVVRQDDHVMITARNYPCTIRLMACTIRPADVAGEAAPAPAPEAPASSDDSVPAPASEDQAISTDSALAPVAKDRTPSDGAPAPAPEAPASSGSVPASSDDSAPTPEAVPTAASRAASATPTTFRSRRLLLEARYAVGLTQEQADDLTAHLLRENGGLLFPALLAAPGDTGTDVVGRVWCTVTAGMSDAQLRETLRSWVMGVMSTFDDLAEQVGLPAPASPTPTT